MLVKDFVDVYQKGNGFLSVIIDGGENKSGVSAYMRNYYADYDIDNITIGKDGYIVLYISKYKKWLSVIPNDTDLVRDKANKNRD